MPNITNCEVEQETQVSTRSTILANLRTLAAYLRKFAYAGCTSAICPAGEILDAISCNHPITAKSARPGPRKPVKQYYHYYYHCISSKFVAAFLR